MTEDMGHQVRGVLVTLGGIELRNLAPAQQQEWCDMVRSALWGALSIEPAVARWLEFRTQAAGRQLTVIEVGIEITALLAGTQNLGQQPITEGSCAVQ